MPVRPQQESGRRSCRTGLGRTQGTETWFLPTQPACGPRNSPESLLRSRAGSLGATGALRLALCSFQCSRQCRSWEWMKRHMSQAWAAHTSSSTQSLQGAEAQAQGWAHASSPGQGNGGGRSPAANCHPHQQEECRLRAPLCSSALEGWQQTRGQPDGEEEAADKSASSHRPVPGCDALPASLESTVQNTTRISSIHSG